MRYLNFSVSDEDILLIVCTLIFCQAHHDFMHTIDFGSEDDYTNYIDGSDVQKEPVD